MINLTSATRPRECLIEYRAGAEEVQNIAGSNTTVENGQVRDLHRDVEDLLAKSPRCWEAWVLGQLPSAGARKLTLSNFLRSNDLGKENAKNVLKTPAAHPALGSFGSCGIER